MNHPSEDMEQHKDLPSPTPEEPAHENEESQAACPEFAEDGVGTSDTHFTDLDITEQMNLGFTRCASRQESDGSMASYEPADTPITNPSINEQSSVAPLPIVTQHDSTRDETPYDEVNFKVEHEPPFDDSATSIPNKRHKPTPVAKAQFETPFAYAKPMNDAVERLIIKEHALECGIRHLEGVRTVLL